MSFPPDLNIPWFVTVVVVSAFAQAVTGFGFGLLALGVLGFSMDPRVTATLLAPAGLVLNLTLFFRLRGHIRWDGIRPLTLAALAGVPVGGFILLHADPHFLAAFLAVTMLVNVAVGFGVRGATSVAPWHPVKAGVPCGFLGGILTGAFGAGGPPVVVYLLNRPLDRFAFIASVQAVFALCAILRVGQFVVLGRIGAAELPTVGLAVAAVGVGAAAGLKCLRHLDDRSVRKGALALILICGLRYLWLAVR
jgi:uncharacterized membrane protein YfcA